MVHRAVCQFCGGNRRGQRTGTGGKLEKVKKQVIAHKLSSIAEKEAYTDVSSSELQVGDICYVKTGEIIPMDGEVIEGLLLSMNRQLPEKAHR